MDSRNIARPSCSWFDTSYANQRAKKKEKKKENNLTLNMLALNKFQ